LPPVVDSDVLARAGVSDSLIPRTLQAMKTLDLLTEDGRPSDVFEGIRLAPSGEYQQRLAEWLTAAYADALTFIDPATDDEVAIRDAFRKYIPTGQQGRMVTLFMGLFTAAGVMPPRQKQPAAKKPQSPAVRPVMSKPRLATQPRGGSSSAQASTPRPQIGGLPPAISGLLATLPNEGGRWTQARRDQFLATFGAVLDYCFVIGEPPVETTEAASAEPAAS
jgi:hypothetical protein